MKFEMINYMINYSIKYYLHSKILYSTATIIYILPRASTCAIIIKNILQLIMCSKKCSTLVFFYLTTPQKYFIKKGNICL